MPTGPTTAPDLEELLDALLWARAFLYIGYHASAAQQIQRALRALRGKAGYDKVLRMEMRKLTVNVPVDLYEVLERTAREQDLTVSQLVRRLLKQGTSQ